MTWGQKFRKLSDTRLEELAVSEFDEKVVLATCRARADEGFTWAEIRPSRPVDISRTAAALAMKETLQKQQLRLEWEPVRDKPDAPAFMVLKVSWDR